MMEALFADVADALRKVAEKRGYEVYVSTNSESITLTERGYVGGGERDYHVKVRTKPRG